MEEGKDYITKAKFVVFMDVFSVYGLNIPQIIAICDTEEIAESIEKDLKEDEKFKCNRIFIAPIINGVKVPKTRLKMNKIKNWIQDKFFTRKD